MATTQWRLAIWLLLNFTLYKAHLKMRLQWATLPTDGPWTWLTLDATEEACDLRKVPKYLGTSVFSSLKWV